MSLSHQQPPLPHPQLRSRSPQASNISFGGSSPSASATSVHCWPSTSALPIQRQRSPIMNCGAFSTTVGGTASVGASGIPQPPHPLAAAVVGAPNTTITDVQSYRSIYASRCAALGDSPNAVDPTYSRHGSIDHSSGMAPHIERSGSAGGGGSDRSSATASLARGMVAHHHRHRGTVVPASSTATTRSPGSASAPRWYASMEHNPSKVLGAPGLVDDAYSQCLAWGSESLAGLLHDQFLLFDVSRPTEVCAAYKLGSTGDDYGATEWSSQHVGGGTNGLPSSRFSCVSMRPLSDRECVVGDTRGLLRFLKCREGSTEATVERYVSLADASGVLGELQLSNSASSPHVAGAGGTPLMRVQAASMASSMSLLFDLSYRSVSCADASDHHPHLFLAGSASGVVALVDSRVQSHGAVVAQARIPLPFSASPSSPCPGVIGDRVLGVSWNSTGSLFAVGSNTGGVSVWSLAKMSEPIMVIPVGSNSSQQHRGGRHTDHHRRHGSGGSSPTTAASNAAATHAVMPSSRSATTSPIGSLQATPITMPQSAAVRAIQFSPTDPFELAYGGGVGDGVIHVTSVLHAGSRPLYTASTGAQVSQIRYSPCGTMLISSHGLRAQDIPAPLPNSNSGGAAPPLYEWGGAPDGPCSRRRYCLAVWSRGKTSTTPSMAFLGGGGGGRGRVGNVAALGSHRRSASRDSLDPSDDDDTASSVVSDADSLTSDDGCGIDSEDADFTGGGSARGASSPSSASSPRRGTSRPLQLKIRLDGHTARPLHLVVPRQNSPYAGMVATAAGGADDGTIRFWNAFQRQRRFTTAASSSSAPASTTVSSRRTSPRNDVTGPFPCIPEDDTFGSLR